MNACLDRVLCPSLPLVYSPRYLALASADYGDRAYILACDYWRVGDRVTAAWCARVFKAHKALYDAMDYEPRRNLCPYCTRGSDTDQEMADHINLQHASLEPQPVTADNWWKDYA